MGTRAHTQVTRPPRPDPAAACVDCCKSCINATPSGASLKVPGVGVLCPRCFNVRYGPPGGFDAQKYALA